MHYAILYLDTNHRIKIFAEGGYNHEKKVDGIGWCLEDDETTYPGTQEAFRELASLCFQHAKDWPEGRIEVGPEDYNATYDMPPPEC